MRRWLFFITIFLSIYSYAANISHEFPLLSKIKSNRVIYSKHTLETNHFKIFWSDSYPPNDLWLKKDENNLPIFIGKLSSLLESSYNIYLENNLTLPQKINVYLLNTDLNATNPPLTLNSISSLGAFTSDELPEILINSKIDGAFVDGHYISFEDRLKSVILHELMHAHQYLLELIKKEDDTNKNLWFIEGLAVAFQLYYSPNDRYFKKIFTNYLSANINKGFLYDDYYLSYTAGLFFEYLVKKGYITFKQFYENINFDKKQYFQNIAKIVGKNIYSLFYEFYKNLNVGKNGDNKKIEFGGAYIADSNATYQIDGFKPKNLTIGDYLVGDGEIKESKVKDIKLKIKSGWNMYILPSKIDELTLNKIDGIVWKYKDNNWSCRGDENINILCKKYFRLITSIDSNEGFWIYSNSNHEIKIPLNFSQKELFYKKGWNLSGNSYNEPIYFDSKFLVWKYEGFWENSYYNDIEINPYEGFWIYRK